MSGGYRKKTLENSIRFLSGPPIAQKSTINIRWGHEINRNVKLISLCRPTILIIFKSCRMSYV